jgi:hypothetical protein
MSGSRLTEFVKFRRPNEVRSVKMRWIGHRLHADAELDTDPPPPALPRSPHRPPALKQCAYLYVFLSCEDKKAGLPFDYSCWRQTPAASKKARPQWRSHAVSTFDEQN